MERYLLRNHAKQFVLTKKATKKDHSTESDSSDFNPTELENVGNHPYYDVLHQKALPNSSSSSSEELTLKPWAKKVQKKEEVS